MKNTKKGFTLVELLIVIAIIAILATVSVVGYVSFIDKANRSADQQIVTQMNKVLQAEKISGDVKVEDVKSLLIENGYNDAFELAYEGHELGWYAEEGVIVLVDTKENKVTYPEKYADIAVDKVQMFKVVFANTVEELVEQIANVGAGNTYSSIVLNQDIALDAGQTLHVDNNAGVELDLNGKTLKADEPVTVTGSGNLVISNGTVESKGQYACFAKNDSTVVLENVVINVVDSGDYSVTTNGSNTDAGSRDSKLVLNNVTTNGGLVFFPAGEITITNCEFNGKAMISGGTVTIENSKFYGDGGNNPSREDFTSNIPLFNSNSGMWTGADALLIAVNRSGYQPVNVTIKNSTFGYKDTVAEENRAYGLHIIDCAGSEENAVATDVIKLEGNTYTNYAGCTLGNVAVFQTTTETKEFGK